MFANGLWLLFCGCSFFWRVSKIHTAGDEQCWTLPSNTGTRTRQILGTP
jgi:hypothetical protein